MKNSFKNFVLMCVFIFSIPLLANALPKCGDVLHNCTGTKTYFAGHKYVGDWLNERRHGKGKYTMIWGLGEYEGDWVDDKRNGKGSQTRKSGNKYVGDWVNDKQHGKGTMFYDNGDKYVGDWIDDEKHGKGTFSSSKGTKYVGNYVEDEKHGKGTFFFKNGAKYVGDWVEDERHGKGSMTWKNGTKYEGDWVKDERTGEGIVTFKDGTVQVGIFENNEFLYSKKIASNKNDIDTKNINEASKKLDSNKNDVDTKNIDEAKVDEGKLQIVVQGCRNRNSEIYPGVLYYSVINKTNKTIKLSLFSKLYGSEDQYLDDDIMIAAKVFLSGTTFDSKRLIEFPCSLVKHVKFGIGNLEINGAWASEEKSEYGNRYHLTLFEVIKSMFLFVNKSKSLEISSYQVPNVQVVTEN